MSKGRHIHVTSMRHYIFARIITLYSSCTSVNLQPCVMHHSHRLSDKYLPRIAPWSRLGYSGMVQKVASSNPPQTIQRLHTVWVSPTENGYNFSSQRMLRH